MIIGIVPDPLRHPDWPQIKAFLEPAAQRGGGEVYRDRWAVWAVYGPELIGAATAHLAEGGWGEVILVGGVNHKRWIGRLDRKIGNWLHDEGMTVVRAYGRKGWRKVLKDWTVIGEKDGITAYERPLA